jgi:hypothetical protein
MHLFLLQILTIYNSHYTLVLKAQSRNEYFKLLNKYG